MFLCMDCGKEREMRDVEEDTYEEYGKFGEYYVVWVYCKDCDCWTQHGLKK